MNTLKNNKGFTMIEAIISMTLMTFILSSATVFVNSTNTTKANLSNISTATQIGTDVIESLRFAEYDSLYEAESNNQRIIDNFYRCKWNIEDSTSYKIINLTIEWPLPNPEHDIELTTIIAK